MRAPLAMVLLFLLVLGPRSVAAAAPAARAADSAASDCQQGQGVRLWTSPAQPFAGVALRVMAVADAPDALGTELTIEGPDRRPHALPAVRRVGPPSSATAVWPKAVAGRTRIRVGPRGGKPLACIEVQVAAQRPQPPAPPSTGTWATTMAWDHAAENFYAAWIQALFDAPSAQTLSFPSLAPIVRDPARNFLHDHLGLGEDGPRPATVLPAEPDCADLPSYLRATFAWKLGLPFGMHDCDRGSSAGPPRCRGMTTNETDLPAPAPRRGRDPRSPTALGSFRTFLRKLANTVHSGSGRAALNDDATDHYAVKLSRESLRPGTIFADPYGHVLMVVKWVPQTATDGGLLFAVDGQPDNSVGRKRFWQGTFLFATDLPSAGPGFKAFRPMERDRQGALVPLSNAVLGKDARFAAFSDEQARLTPDAFYARMGKLINPRGLPPRAAYEEMLAALIEQLQTRLGSVDTGEAYMQKSAGAVVPMPEGTKIFETVGPWEDYATPSRDMRLIIAMNVLSSMPQAVIRHPELFVLGGRSPTEVRDDLQTLHEKLTAERSIEYRRTDGTLQKLTVANLLSRKRAFEVAYNPNDCVELRWGAPEGTDEHRSCTRRAPGDQRSRMESVRAWFREAKRPPR